MAPVAVAPQPLQAPPTMLPAQAAGHAALKRSLADSRESSPLDSKRKKVTFEAEPEIHHLTDDADEKSVPLIREEIIHAIRRRYNGDSEEYDTIKSLFDRRKQGDDRPSTGLLQKYLLGLISNADVLDKSCSDLVHVVLEMQWLARDDDFVRIYIRFLGNLISLQTGYLSTVMKMLVENFAHLSSSAGPNSVRVLGDRLRLQARVHSAMRYVLLVVPSASSMLSSIFTSSFPFPMDTKKSHVEYVRNILLVVDYAPELKGDVLDLICERLTKIDVQTQIDLDELEEIFEGDLGDMITQGTQKEGSGSGDAAIEDPSDAEESDSDDEMDEEERRFRDLKLAVEKMDAIVDILFAYHTPSITKGSEVESRATIEHLLSEFRKTILPSQRSRHVQFLLFHFAQTSQEYISLFATACTEIVMDHTCSTVLRVSAAAYVASFIARGAKVSSAVVGYVFNILGAYLNKLLREYEPNCKHPNLQKYNVYYATAQALIYIFCFRWRDLLADPEDYEDEDYEDLFDGRELVWAPRVKETLSKNFNSKLNPLKVCAPEIVEEFARVAHHLRFLYVYQIMEANKRVQLQQLALSSQVSSPGIRETAISGIRGERHQQLDLYFPFDPYRLPKSKSWLVGDYNEWKGVPGPPEAHGEAGEESSDEDEDDEEEAEGNAIPGGDELTRRNE